MPCVIVSALFFQPGSSGFQIKSRPAMIDLLGLIFVNSASRKKDIVFGAQSLCVRFSSIFWDALEAWIEWWWLSATAPIAPICDRNPTRSPFFFRFFWRHQNLIQLNLSKAFGKSCPYRSSSRASSSQWSNSEPLVMFYGSRISGHELQGGGGGREINSFQYIGARRSAVRGFVGFEYCIK